MKLIIVESPTKATTLNKFLGSGYDVDSTKGHIKDLPKSKLSVDVEHDFKPNYEVVEKQSAIIKNLQKKAKEAEGIFIATDPDREGEAIAQHVYEILTEGKKDKIKPDTIKRITFHEITQSAVEDAIEKSGSVDINLVNAQIARRVLDRLVGYTLSPVLWRKVRRGLSAGRVQSVAVRLIVEKEEEIKKFKAEEYWQIFSELKGNKNQFVTELVKIDGIKAVVKNKKNVDEIVADLKTAKYIVADIRKKEVSKKPYSPFTTSTLTQTSARFFSWSAKKTMRMAQGLYEKGLITYHRTDSHSLAKSAVDSAREFIKKEYGSDYLPEGPVVYKTKSKSAQEAHEAIRVTDVKVKTDQVEGSSDEQKLYDLIRRRFLACQMNPAKYSETSIDVSAGKYILRVGGQTMIFDGWRKLFPTDGEAVMLPEIEKGDKLDLIKTWGDQKFTQPPARFNEASLIKMLEKLGIGRPSTYAPIISTIQARSYVEKKDAQFLPTTVGVAVTKFLMANFMEELEYNFTAEMEDDLDKVATGKLDWTKMMGKFWGPFGKKAESVTKNAERIKIETEKLGKKCPDCKDGELVIRVGRFGKFISCSTFPECKHTEKFLDKIDMICPDCKKGEVIIKKTRIGRSFFGCSLYPDCEFASWKKPVDGKFDKKNNQNKNFVKKQETKENDVTKEK
ncbi:type I DNA topoisomerase [Candidatus Microgenomates bacterium]|nr:type I DNA topoisomerase [Candidatus Microgenomates bacterium]